MNLYEQLVLSGVAQPLDLLNESGYSSPGLFREVAALPAQAVKKTQVGLEWILGHGLQDRLVIVGGTAVAFHSAPRPLTPDLDFVCLDLAEVEHALAADGVQTSPLSLPPDWFDGGVQAVPFDTDFMSLANKRFQQHLFATSVQGRLGGGTFRFASAPMMFVFKNMTGRTKDLDDAVKLLGTLRSGNQIDNTKTLLKTLRKDRVLDRDAHDDINTFLF